MRVLFVWPAVFLLVLIASGCVWGRLPSKEDSFEGTAPVKITLWAQETKDPRQTAFQEMIRNFNTTNKHIQIVPYFYETEAYKNKLRVAMVSGKMPDIFYYWAGAGFKQMIESQVVADLSPLLELHPDLKNQFIPESLQSSSYNGRIYGIPNAVSHVLVWYNRDIFESHHLKPPTNWNELLDTVQTLSAQRIIPIAIAGKERWPILHWFAYLSQRLGGNVPFQRVLTKDGDFTDPSFVEAGMHFHELVKRKAFPPSFLGMDIMEAEKSFLSGESAMYMQGDWSAGKLLNANIQRDTIGYFPFPVMGDKGVPSEYYGGYSTGLAISANSNIQEAFEVLSYLMSMEQRKMYSVYTGSLSPVKDLPLSRSDTLPEIYNYIQFIKRDPTGYFGYYDQVLDPRRAQQLLDAVVTFAGEEDMKREDIEAVLSQIR